MRNSALVRIKGSIGAIVLELDGSPKKMMIVIRRALRDNRARVRDNPGMIASRIIRYATVQNWLSNEIKPEVPYRYSYEIDAEAKVPTIRILEYASPTVHRFGRLLHKGGLFAWVGAERKQITMAERLSKRDATIERRKRWSGDLAEVQQRNDAELKAGKRVYTESQLRLRNAIAEATERDRREKQKQPHLTGRDRPFEEQDDEA